MEPLRSAEDRKEEVMEEFRKELNKVDNWYKVVSVPLLSGDTPLLAL